MMKLNKNAYNQNPEFDIDDPIPILKIQTKQLFPLSGRKKWMVLPYLPFIFNGKTSAAIIHGTNLY